MFSCGHEDAKVAVEYIKNLENGKNSIWAGESAGGGYRLDW